MALNTNLNTNELKNASGTEVEFFHVKAEGSRRILKVLPEVPSLPVTLTIQHSETGSGIKRRRRSNIRIDSTSLSTVDNLTPVTTTASFTIDTPVGAVSTMAEAKKVLALLTSFVATNGTSTFVYDGTGTGAAALIDGSL